MTDYDSYDSVPDLSSLIGYDMPDEIDTRAELDRLDTRSAVYALLDDYGLLCHARAIA